MSSTHPASFFLSSPGIPHTLTAGYRAVTLPLWSPSAIEIGSVGYLRKPEGTFVTLFNALDPPQTSGGVLEGMASLHGYGKVSQGSYRQDKRDRARRGLDAIRSWLAPKLDS